MDGWELQWVDLGWDYKSGTSNLYEKDSSIHLSQRSSYWSIWILNLWFSSEAEGMKLVEIPWASKFVTPFTSNTYLSFMLSQEEVAQPGALGRGMCKGSRWATTAVCLCFSLANTSLFVAYCFLCLLGVFSTLPASAASVPSCLSKYTIGQ